MIVTQPAHHRPGDDERGPRDRQVTFYSRADRGAEDDQGRGDPAEHDRGQHERECPQPLGHELAVHRHFVGDVQPRLQRGHAAGGAPQRDHDAEDQRGQRGRADRLVAACTAWVNTPDAPGGSALSSPLTSRCTVLEPMWIRLARPSSAISAGNRARNQ